MQNKPNLQKSNMNVTPLLTMEYENIRLYRRDENKPNIGFVRFSAALHAFEWK
jgi:hypothetical protein